MTKLRLDYGKDEARHASKLLDEGKAGDSMYYVCSSYLHFAYNRVVSLVNNSEEFDKEQRRIAKKLTMTFRDANYNFEFSVFKEDGSVDEEEQNAYIYFLAMVTKLYDNPKLGVDKAFAEEILKWISERYEEKLEIPAPEVAAPAITTPDFSKEAKDSAVKKAAEEARQ